MNKIVKKEHCSIPNEIRRFLDFSPEEFENALEDVANRKFNSFGKKVVADLFRAYEHLPKDDIKNRLQLIKFLTETSSGQVIAKKKIINNEVIEKSISLKGGLNKDISQMINESESL